MRRVCLPDGMVTLAVFLTVDETFFQRSIFRTPSTYTRIPSSPAALSANGPPEPKSRVTLQRTPKLSFGRPETGAPLQDWSIASSQSVFFGVPEKDVFA